MRDAANRKDVRHAVGLQGQVSPAINYTKDLIAEGYVGRVLYPRLAESIRDGKPVSPGFDAAVTRHRLIDAIVRASETGMKQGSR